MTTPEEIADKLSEAQREWLLRDSDGTHFWGGRNDSLPNWQDIGHDLGVAGVIKFVSETSSATRLTPLGAEVRALLSQGERR